MVRSGTRQDAEAVLALWTAAGAEPSVTDDIASIWALLAHDPRALIVAELDGEIVASLIAGFDGWRANMYRLAVHPRVRRQGLGSELVAEAERRFVLCKIRRSSALVVTERSEAVSFWESAGYARDRRIGRHVKNLDGAPERG